MTRSFASPLAFKTSLELRLQASAPSGAKFAHRRRLLVFDRSPDDLLAKLQRAGRRDLGDFMTFEIGPDDNHPTIHNDGMQYDGFRFRAECKLAGKRYGDPFNVDIAF